MPEPIERTKWFVSEWRTPNIGLPTSVTGHGSPESALDHLKTARANGIECRAVKVTTIREVYDAKAE